MARKIDASLSVEVFRLIAEGLSHREIALKLGIAVGTVSKIRNAKELPEQDVDISSALLRSDAISWIRKQKEFDLDGLSFEVGVDINQAKKLVEYLSHHDGYNIIPKGSGYEICSDIPIKGKLNLDRLVGKEYKFGLVTDTHLCNKHARLDGLEAAYDEFKRLGIKDVYHAGNIIDGEHRFNRYEIDTHGSHNQCQYVADHYPQRNGIKTMFVTGDCHEGWYQGREGINIGWYIQKVCEDSGRKDVIHIGHGERDVVINQKFGSTRMRIMHPGGGSAYALSYPSQKMVESFQGGEKPHMLVLGHYHKFDVNYAREVVTIQAGCLEDQTSFMRKKRLAAHVGFCVCRVNSRIDGTVGRCNVDWYPMYDKKYHQKLEDYSVA